VQPQASGALELIACGINAARLEEYANAIRDAGLAVHAELAEDTVHLHRLTQNARRDLVLLMASASTDFLATAISLRAKAPDVQLVLLSENPGQHLHEAMELGARDVVDPGDVARVAFTAQREYYTLLLQRELHQARNKVQEVEHRSNALIEASRDAIAYVHEGMHVHANRSYIELFGYADLGDMEGLPIMDLIASTEREAFKNVLKGLERAEGTEIVDTICRTQAGESFPATIECSNAQVDSEPCIQIVIRDQHGQYAFDDRGAEASSLDSLTGLLNRQAFLERLDVALTGQDTPPSMTLILISVSNFADLRRRTSSAEVDELLRNIALTLSATIPAHKVISARLSDHEFALLCPRDIDATGIARRCYSTLPRRSSPSDKAANSARYCLGLAASTDPPIASAHQWLDHATRALNEADRHDAGGIALFKAETADQSGTAQVDHALIDLIDHALEHDRFTLKYQPIVSLQGDAREHYAVLVRLLDHSNTELLPESFFDQAARAERIADIDRWVIRHSIKELAQQRLEGRKVVFFLALSRATVATESILLWVCDCLREFKAKGAWLVFQFRESDIEQILEPAKRLIDGLRKINCRIAVDHYTGSQSVAALLPQLDLDAVKLSPSFTQDLVQDAAQQTTLRAMHDTLQRRGLKTVATAVEDATSLAVLWNIGVHFIQGYFLHRPTGKIDN
jgi:diguanylate cyclase (GGDEF)-like protein/PAS domain S-box-containing protein